MKNLGIAAAVIATLMVGASSAQAALALDYLGMGSHYGTVKIQGFGAASGINGAYYAGWEKISISGESPFETMCIDVGDLAADDADAKLVSLELAPDAWAGPMGVDAARNIKLLWGKYATGATTPLEAAALQIAIWKTIDNAMGTYDLTFEDYGTTGAVDRANSMLADLGSTSADLMAITGIHQDFLVPVPEPTTMIAGTLLLLPFAASTLRRMRKTS